MRRSAANLIRAFVWRDGQPMVRRFVWRGKGVPGQSTALHLRGRRVAPTSLRCSVLQPAAELAAFASLTALKQLRRVSLRSALARAAASPVLLGAPQARRGLPGHAFAATVVACVPNGAREEPSRQAVPVGGDLWSDEDRRPGVGARSALRGLTRRSCLSATNEVSEASSATRPLVENRSAVGAQRRPRNHEPTAGTAWRDAKALGPPAGAAWRDAKTLQIDTRGQSAHQASRAAITAAASHASRVARSAVEQLK